MNQMMTITEVAERVGVSTRTIMRWEATGKVEKPKRNWRGWRVYDHNGVLKS
jgi:excisionase family DNA binding protein